MPRFTAPITYIARNPLYKDLLKDKLSRQHFMMHNGFALTHAEPGYIEVEAPILQHLQQQDGMVHGGVTATIADLATGFAAFTLTGPDDRVVTSELSISYFRPGKGDIIFARGWVIKPGNRLMYCEGEIYTIHNEELTLIAKTTSIMAVIIGKNKEIEG